MAVFRLVVISAFGGITFDLRLTALRSPKRPELVDVMGKLKAGDTVRLVYDSCNSRNALFAGGSETLSVKNAIRWDIGYYCITLIVGVFLFLMIDASFD